MVSANLIEYGLSYFICLSLGYIIELKKQIMQMTEDHEVYALLQRRWEHRNILIQAVVPDPNSTKKRYILREFAVSSGGGGSDDAPYTRKFGRVRSKILK